ncbi:histidine protein methyltransferase 1 homolog [Papilio machaon]|uniref:histidine protein methyltransferase 1 homolog n=1 Tax=Papilio machaon TaxID=76193 RepID=UPI001E663A80|nr:histidine protein methyltransferase 1 homolog [Papilio machaon]
MSTFKFNFLGNTDNDKTEDEHEEIKWFECEEIIPDKQINNLDDVVVHAKMFICEDIEIGHVSSCDKLFSSGDYTFNALELAEKEHSDLIAGKYEGGLKVWECTSDVIKYLLDNPDINFKGAKVLDLGCGVGILGIYALLNDSIVTFQDYNKEIIECVTIPSVLLNIENEQREEVIKKCKFYSGDWASFDKKLANTDIYDIILTSETIYNEKNYEKLTNIFLNRLSKDGSAYVAAKTCYFGVGGGMRQFETYIQKTGSLKSEVAWKSSGGIQREILKIKRI